jgi:hypothetical protein
MLSEAKVFFWKEKYGDRFPNIIHLIGKKANDSERSGNPFHPHKHKKTLENSFPLSKLYNICRYTNTYSCSQPLSVTAFQKCKIVLCVPSYITHIRLWHGIPNIQFHNTCPSDTLNLGSVPILISHSSKLFTF